MRKKTKVKERIIEMWAVGEKRVGSHCLIQKKRLFLYKRKPRKKNYWDLIVKVKVIAPIISRKDL